MVAPVCVDANPPAVDGLAVGCCERNGERLDAVASTESIVALEREDSLRNESCERDECVRGPDGDLGGGGGLKGG